MELLENISVAAVPPSAEPLLSGETPKNKGGRPKGSKTRPDAPSMVAKRAKLSQQATFGGLPSPGVETTKPDTDIFGEQSEPEPESATDPTPTGNANPGTESQTHIPEPEDTNADPETHRTVASVLWDSIVGLLAAFIGPFWWPRKVGTNPEKGEIPFDEREMVVKAFMQYFASIGMVAMTPLAALWLAIAGYCMPRLHATINVVKTMFIKKKAPVKEEKTDDSRFAPKPENNGGAEKRPEKNITPQTKVEPPPQRSDVKPVQNPSPGLDAINLDDSN